MVMMVEAVTVMDLGCVGGCARISGPWARIAAAAAMTAWLASGLFNSSCGSA